jgi:hypothetical protein
MSGAYVTVVVSTLVVNAGGAVAALPISIGPEWLRVLGHLNPLYYVASTASPSQWTRIPNAAAIAGIRSKLARGVRHSPNMSY